MSQTLKIGPTSHAVQCERNAPLWTCRHDFPQPGGGALQHSESCHISRLLSRGVDLIGSSNGRWMKPMEPHLVLWGVLYWPLCLPGIAPSLSQEDESPNWLSGRSRVPHKVQIPCWKRPTVLDTSRRLLSRFRMAPACGLSYRTHTSASSSSLLMNSKLFKNYEARKLEDSFPVVSWEILCIVWGLSACLHIKRSFLSLF